MHAVVRRYKGSDKLFEELERRHSEVEAIIKDVPGLVGYYLIRDADGGASVTVCQDKAGTDESIRVAAEWIRANVSGAGGSPPEITEGRVIVQV